MQSIMSEKMITQVEDMAFRFKTNRPLAVLMKTFDSSWDRLEIALIVGKIRLALKIGEKEKVTESRVALFHRKKKKKQTNQIDRCAPCVDSIRVYIFSSVYSAVKTTALCISVELNLKLKNYSCFSF